MTGNRHPATPHGPRDLKTQSAPDQLAALSGFSCTVADGTIAATYLDPTGTHPHSFLRDTKGAITNIDVPGPEAVNRTEVNGIGANGVIVGDYRDSNFTLHGYIRIP